MSLSYKNTFKRLLLLAAGVLFGVNCLTAAFAQEAAEDVPLDQSQEDSVLRENRGQASYTVDLKKLIDKSKANLKRVDEKIKEQAVYKRNQLREEKAQEYFERADQLFSEGKAEEARELWEKAIKITEHPEMKSYKRESTKRLKAQQTALKKEEQERSKRIEEEEGAKAQRVFEAYDRAVSFYRQKKFVAAKDEFELVEELEPGFKATRSYLKIVDQDIATADAQAIKNQQKEMERQHVEADRERKKQKEMWRQEIEAKEKQKDQEIRDQAEQVYVEALKLYKDKKYLPAKEKFQEVEWVLPNYKTTRKYLVKIEKDIKKEERFIEAEQRRILQRERWEEELARKKAILEREEKLDIKDDVRRREEAEFVYQGAVALFKKEKYMESRSKFLEVEALVPEYKATKTYLEHIEQFLGILPDPDTKEGIAASKMPRPEMAQKLTEDAEPLYAEAVGLLNKKSYQEAGEKFRQVDEIFPDYKSTRVYLRQLDTLIEHSAVTSEKEIKIKEANEISQLAARASSLYDQVSEIKDSDTAETRKKLGKIDTLFSRMAQEQNDLIARLQREEKNLRKQELLDQAIPLYEEALKMYKDKNYEVAKNNFLKVDTLIPDYRSTRVYLSRIDKQIKGMTVEERIEQKQRMSDVAQGINVKEKQERINTLVAQANALNDEILKLADSKDYDALDAKFNELEKVVSALRDVKGVRQKNIVQTAKKYKIGAQDVEKEDPKKLADAKEARKSAKKEKKAAEVSKAESDKSLDPVLEKSKRKAEKEFERMAVKEQKKNEAKKQDLDKELARSKALADQTLESKGMGRSNDYQLNDMMQKRREYIERKFEEEQRVLESRQKMEEKRLKEALKQEELERKRLDKAKLNQSRMEQVRYREDLRSASPVALGSLPQERAVVPQPRYEPVQQVVAERPAPVIKPKAIPPVTSQITQDQMKVRKEFVSGVDDMYRDAVHLYKQRRYDLAEQRFREVEDMMPNYKKTRNYMQKIPSTPSVPLKTKSETGKLVVRPKTPQVDVDLESVATPRPSRVSRESLISDALDLFDPAVR